MGEVGVGDEIRGGVTTRDGHTQEAIDFDSDEDRPLRRGR